MCAILDASARDDVFGEQPTAAGKQFFEWLETRRGRLVLGGRLTDELFTSRAFQDWVAPAVRDGRVKVVQTKAVQHETLTLAKDWTGKSNDQHVIALARVSKARILYAEDEGLRRDFKNTALVHNPVGLIYPTGESRKAAKHRRALLNRPDLCPNR